MERQVPAQSIQWRLVSRYFPAMRMPEDQWDYAISMEWFSKWRSLLTTTAASPIASKPSEAECSLKPVGMEASDENNCYIGESLWMLLVSWYGLSSDHDLRRCYKVSKFEHIGNYSTETSHILTSSVDFLDVFICWVPDLNDISKRRIFKLYLWNNIDYLCFQIKRVLKVPAMQHVQVWLILQQSSKDICVQILDQNCSMAVILSQVCPKFTSIMNSRELQNYTLNNLLLNTEINITLAVSKSPTLQFSRGMQANVEEFSQKLDEFQNTVGISSVESDWEVALNGLAENFVNQTQKSVSELKRVFLEKAKSVVNKKMGALSLIEDDMQIQAAILKQAAVKTSERQQELSEIERVLNDQKSRFQVATRDFEEKKLKLEAELNEMDSLNQITQSKIQLDIGGHSFTTSLETLLREPESKLGTMFSGRYSIAHETSGSYFIDRDGTNFRYVLNYLRDGPKAVESLPVDPTLLKELLGEAEYYRLPKFLKLLNFKLKNLQKN